MPQSRSDENQYFSARTVVERDDSTTAAYQIWFLGLMMVHSLVMRWRVGFDNSCMRSAKSSSSGTRMLSLRLFDEKSVKMVPESVIEA